MSRWWQRLAGICVPAVALMAGCSGGGASGPSGRLSSPTAGTTLASASVEPVYPNTKPGEQSPVRPLDVLSGAGAEAFAVYFVKVIDWAYASMDTAPLLQASSPECTLCASLVQMVNDRKALGDVYLGSRFTILDSQVFNGPTSNTRLTNIVISYNALTIRHPDGSIEADGEAQPMIQLNVRVRFENNAWVVYEAKRVVQQ